jgi:hypothetical protein
MNPIIKTTTIRALKGSGFSQVTEYKKIALHFLPPNHTNYAA